MLKDAIELHGGLVVCSSFKGIADYAVVPISGAELSQTATEIVTHLWIVSIIFMFAPCISSIKTPTDAHYYKIIEMLKQFKIIILAPTCFSSRRNHHQGAVLCLDKTTNMVFCACRYRRSQCYGGVSACCAGVWFALQTARLHNRLIH